MSQTFRIPMQTNFFISGKSSFIRKSLMNKRKIKKFSLSHTFWKNGSMPKNNFFENQSRVPSFRVASAVGHI